MKSRSNCSSLCHAAVTQSAFKCSLQRMHTEWGWSSLCHRDAIGLQMQLSYDAVFELGQPMSRCRDAIGFHMQPLKDVAHELRSSY